MHVWLRCSCNCLCVICFWKIIFLIPFHETSVSTHACTNATNEIYSIFYVNARIYFLFYFLSNVFSFPWTRLIQFKILQIQFSSFGQLPVSYGRSLHVCPLEVLFSPQTFSRGWSNSFWGRGSVRLTVSKAQSQHSSMLPLRCGPITMDQRNPMGMRPVWC